MDTAHKAQSVGVAIAVVLAALALYVSWTRPANVLVVEKPPQTIWNNQTIWHNTTTYRNITEPPNGNGNITPPGWAHARCPDLPIHAKAWGVRARCGL